MYRNLASLLQQYQSVGEQMRQSKINSPKPSIHSTRFAPVAYLARPRETLPVYGGSTLSINRLLSPSDRNIRSVRVCAVRAEDACKPIWNSRSATSQHTDRRQIHRWSSREFSRVPQELPYVMVNARECIPKFRIDLWLNENETRICNKRISVFRLFPFSNFLFWFSRADSFQIPVGFFRNLKAMEKKSVWNQLRGTLGPLGLSGLVTFKTFRHYCQIGDVNPWIGDCGIPGNSGIS